MRKKRNSQQIAAAVLRAMVPILLYATVSTVLTFLQDQWAGWPVKSLTGRTVLMNLICIPLMTVLLIRDGRLKIWADLKYRKKDSPKNTQNVRNRQEVQHTQNVGNRQEVQHTQNVGNRQEVQHTQNIGNQQVFQNIQNVQKEKDSEDTQKNAAVRLQVLFLRILLLLVIFLAGAVCSMASSYLMSVTGIYARFSNGVQEELLKAPLWLQLTGLGLIVPVSEEMIYRGLVYQRLKEGLSPVVAAVFMAAVFSLGHGNLIQILYAFPSGLLLAYIMEEGGLSAAVVFHMGANLFSVVVALL